MDEKMDEEEIAQITKLWMLDEREREGGHVWCGFLSYKN
jgi:hypothetical protein